VSATHEVAEPRASNGELITLLWSKCEAAKNDLENNWTYQMIVSVVNLGILLGFGDLASKHVFKEEGRENVLFIAMPMIALYLFMRFGGLLTAFSEVRMEPERLCELYSGGEPERLAASTIFHTNSYFEYYHRPEINFGVTVYCMFVPIILATNMSTSIYMIWHQIGHPSVAFFVCFLYLIPVGTLYYMFHQRNRHNKFVLPSIVWSISLTLIIGFLLFAYSGSVRIGPLAHCS